MTKVTNKTNELIFKGKVFNGEYDMEGSKMVCIPSKPRYATVELALKCSNFSISIGEILNDSLSFEEKIKLGRAIANRWNKVET